MSLRLRTGLIRFQLKLNLLQRRFSRVQSCVDALLALEPGDAHALATLAHLQAAEQGQPEAAVHTLKALLAYHPDHAAAWFNLGYLHESLGQVAAAELAFVKATRLNPGLDRAWYGLALCLIRQRRLDEAVDALHQNTELQPMSPYGWYQLARVQMERQQPEAAASIVQRLRGFEPKVAAQLERELGELA